MKVIISLFLLSLGFFVSSVTAQQEVTIESISNLYNNCDSLLAGSIHTVRLRVRNVGTPANSWFNYTNAIRIYSPDGANFGPVTADTVLNPSTPGKAYLGKLQSPNCSITYLSADGLLDDTIIFFGENSSTSNPGLYSGFDTIAWTVSFISRLNDSSRHICIEALNVPQNPNWQWLGNGTNDTIPDWNFNLCLTIAAIPNLHHRLSLNNVPLLCEPPPPSCCQGTTGNIDCDVNGSVDIADLTVLVDRLFISFGMLCCQREANVDADGTGSIDIADLTRLVDHLFITFDPLPGCPLLP